MTTGANLPFERIHLEKYCPHDSKKARLVTQWLITSQVTFYKIKNDNCVISHLKKYRIYMNLTNVQAKQSRVLGFFVFSHSKYNNRKAAHKELLQHLFMAGFNLHNHHCKDNFRRDIQAVAFASNPNKSCTTKGRARELATYWALKVCLLHVRRRDYGCLYSKHVPCPKSLPLQDNQYFNERISQQDVAPPVDSNNSDG
eukprot:11514454-Ditylum_brightwellii.AAC.1